VRRVAELVARIVFRLAWRIPVLVLASATLICLAPGFDSDERQLDLRLSSESIDHIRQSRAQQGNPVKYSLDYLAGLLRGDLGYSATFSRSVAEMMRERIGVTLNVVTFGVLTSWVTAFAISIGVLLFRQPRLQVAAATSAATLLCLPSSLMAFIALLLTWHPTVAMAAILYPRVYSYFDSIFESAGSRACILAAEAQGIARIRLVTHHILPLVKRQIFAVLPGAVAIGLSSAIPLEVICDVSGIGQLAWKATLARDLPLLLSLTLTVATITTTVSALNDIQADQGQALQS
jgi:ABC-type dipeptide/oligopeptide/nickel transport system permease component